MCGWTSGIAFRGDNQNTEYDALQITLAKQFSKGLAVTGNYSWDSAFDEQSGYYTWSKVVTHGRDGNTRDQAATVYGSYDLPFGKGKQFAPTVNRLTDLLIGGYQISAVANLSGGQPFTASFSNFGTSATPQTCNENTGGSSAPCRPNATGKISKSLTAFDPVSKTRKLWSGQASKFSFPGLDTIGNAGLNNNFGPLFFNADLALTKAFTIHENIVTKFRMDAFNGFNHINAGNPNNDDVLGNGPINGQAAGGATRQLEFSLRVQF